MPALIRRFVDARLRPLRSAPPVPARTQRVPAADGTRLHVEEHGAANASPTVILTHGWTLDCRTWDHQLTGLADRLPTAVRILAYDHRGHGRSDATARETTTLDQLGDDLAAVLRARVPSGPIVLAGHSMGGMTIMTLAERHPELFAQRVAGVVFVSTSCGGLADVTYGLPRSLAPWLRRAEDAAGRRMVARSGTGAAGGAGGGGPWVSARTLRPGLRWLLFGQAPPSDDLDRTAAAVAATPPVSVVGFRATLGVHDRRDALAACSELPVVVACGTRDRLCPPSHARAIARAIPGSQLLLYPKAGHMLPLERADEVTDHIAAVARATGCPAGA